MNVFIKTMVISLAIGIILTFHMPEPIWYFMLPASMFCWLIGILLYDKTLNNPNIKSR